MGYIGVITNLLTFSWDIQVFRRLMYFPGNKWLEIFEAILS